MSKWASEFVNTNGIQGHFNRTSGGGKPLILVHGITDNGLCWTRWPNRWNLNMILS